MKNLFDSVEIRKIRLKNRLIRSATWEGIAEIDGSIGADTYEIYRELAKGGVGAIITGFTSVSAEDFYFGGMMRLCDDFDSAIQKIGRNYSCGGLRGDKSAYFGRILQKFRRN